MNVMRRIIQFVFNWARIELGSPPNIREAARQMLLGLEQHRTAASLAMALADEARERLEEAVDNNEAFGRQAADFLRDGDEVAAKRLVGLQLQAVDEVQRLSGRYQELQQEAERAAASFKKEQAGVQARLDELPRVEDDARYLEERERITELSRFSLESPTRDFDAAAREFRVRRKQLDAKVALAADPNAAIDAHISATIAGKKLDEAMDALRHRVDQDAGVVNAEFTDVTDPVSDARKLLEAPRFSGLALPGRTAQPLRVVRGSR